MWSLNHHSDSSTSGNDNTIFVQPGNIGRGGFLYIIYEKGKNKHKNPNLLYS
jgi:hypothetical protein